MSPAVPSEDIVLLRDCVRHRFMHGYGNAIVLALEGFKWLLGEESAVTRDSLKEEQKGEQ